MESVIYEDSLLAEFLQAMGEANDEWPATTKPAISTSTGSDSISFAPRGTARTKARKYGIQIPEVVFTEGIFSHMRRKCMDILAWRIRQSDQIKALEQLRFTIIGSQLLTDSSVTGASTQKPSAFDDRLSDGHPLVYTISGIFYTVGAAFACALSLWWATETADLQTRNIRVGIVSIIIMTIGLAASVFCLRQYRRYTRKYAVRTTAAMISNEQAFDSVALAASRFIQEVELVSRGYQLSNPLPPASRLDDHETQTRRCQRLRHALRRALDDLQISHVKAYNSLRQIANAANLERYYDMYEISRSDIEEVVGSVETRGGDNDSETLRILKVDLHRLFMARKMFLCSILGLDAEDPSSSFDWIEVTKVMADVCNTTASATKGLQAILSEEEFFDAPASPRCPVTPNRERLQHHVRRFANLSHGLRGLQAKMHILRDESNRSLGSTDEVTQLGSYFLEQYDTIGNDLKNLLAEWEEGRASLALSVAKNERRISSNFAATPLSPPSRSSSRSNSLGGLTVVGGSPSDALRIISGDIPIATEGTSSEEEVFEALALPKPREGQSLNREERIARMREDRMRLAAVKERTDASRFMVKELETVIKARPRHRKGSSPMVPMPVRIPVASSIPSSPTAWNHPE